MIRPRQSPSLRLVFQDGASLSADQIAAGEVVRSGWIDVFIESAHTPSATLNGIPLTIRRLKQGEWLAGLDLARSAGLHELAVAGAASVLLRVDDGKISGDEYISLLTFVGRRGFGTRGASAAVDARMKDAFDLHIPAATRWLERRARLFVTEVDALLAELPRTSQNVSSLSERAKPPFDLNASFAAYRQQPTLLERHPGGALIVESDSWMPLKAVSIEPRYRVVEEIQAICALGCRLVKGLLEATSAVSHLGLERREASAGIVRLNRRLPILHSRAVVLVRTDRSFNANRSRLERTTPRCAKVMKLVAELRQLARPLGPTVVGEILAATRSPDKLYEVFVAQALSEMLELQTSVPLGGAGRGRVPYAESKEYRLFTQTSCRALGLNSWRAESELPDTPIPDAVIERVADGRCLVVDAKYRRELDLPDNDSMRTAHYYMDTLSSRRALIVYPPAASERKPFTVAGEGKHIACLPLRPLPESLERCRASLLAQVKDLFDGSASRAPYTGAMTTPGEPARSDSSL